MARSSSFRPGRSLGALAIVIAMLYGVIGGGVLWSNAQWTPKLGLDLEGGTDIVMVAVPQTGTSGKVTQQTIDEAVNIIRQRINGQGVSESSITTQGNNQIEVSLPGKTDQATRDAVTRSAALEFRAVLAEQATTTAATSTSSPTTSPSGSAKSSSPAKGSSATTSASAKPSASSTSSAQPSASAKPSASHAALGRLSDPSSGTGASGSGAGAGYVAKDVAFASAASTSPTSAPSPTSAAASSSASSTGATGAAASAAAKATGSAAAKATGSAAAKATGSATTATATPTNASDENWVTQAVAAQFSALDCSKEVNRGGLTGDDLSKPLVTCSTDGAVKYVLGPAELKGSDISDASASLVTNSQGNVGTAWQVNLSFTGSGSTKFATVTKRLASLTGAQNQFAIVLDGLVVSAPQTDEAITGGQAQITGSFSQEEAQSLANQLKFGALPISFKVLTQQDISATLGSEQLQRGLLAGVIGLILVVLYSLAQYRALGMVTVASLVIAGTITFGLVDLLSWRDGYRLSLSGVAGLIVSIGITADSFIVFFERVRDEVRDGRALVPAVEAAWSRARRTILISDGVSFLAAAVLYILAISDVKGFAFTLGLTTLVDVFVVFLFTHPTLVAISRTRFFGGGNRWSGFDAEHLGRAVAYTGRGGVREPTVRRQGRRLTATPPAGPSGTAARTGSTIAERRAAAQAAAEHAEGPDAGGGRSATGDDPPSGPDPADLRALQTEAAGDTRRRDS